jgi:fermentation-respiration switch protein FrsA (DUF1100 family)
MSLPVLISLSILIPLLLVLLVIYLIVCGMLVKFMSHPKREDMAFTYQVDVDKGLIPSKLPYQVEEIVIPCRDKTEIHGELLLHENPVGVVIIAHGYTWTRNGSIKYAQIFEKLGYTCLIFDERGHGENKTDFCSMGFYEGRDINDIIIWTKNRFKGLPIGLHGESMGAASVLMSLKEKPGLKFIIEDCGYSSLYDLIRYKLKQMHLIPGLFIHTADLMLKIKYGYHLKDVEPKKWVKDIDIPLLIIHGEKDDFVPSYMANEIYEANKNHCQIVTFENAGHALSYQTNKEKYEKVLTEFVNNIERERLK